MRSNYDDALSRLLKHEGGYSNHPSDPGGPTKYGITIHDYRKYVKPGATASDVKAMTLDEAKGIYRAKYWDVQRCDDLPSGVDYAIFDYGVNSGVGRSGKVLRRILDMPDNTHTITGAVVTAANKRDPRELVIAICEERLAFLKRLKTWPTFGKGWGRRVAEVKAHSLKLVGVPAPPDVEPVPKEGVNVPNSGSFLKRWWKWITGSGVLGTLTIGGVTFNADIIYAIGGFLVIAFVVFLGWVYLVPPRGQIRKGLT